MNYFLSFLKRSCIYLKLVLISNAKYQFLSKVPIYQMLVSILFDSFTKSDFNFANNFQLIMSHHYYALSDLDCARLCRIGKLATLRRKVSNCTKRHLVTLYQKQFKRNHKKSGQLCILCSYRSF